MMARLHERRDIPTVHALATSPRFNPTPDGENNGADDYAAALAQSDPYHQQLAAAARLGQSDAALERAELTGVEADFRHAPSLPAPEDATRLLDLADSFRSSATVFPLLTQAALAGDVEAMCQLTEHYESDPVEAWTWVHLADLCGTNLTRMEAEAGSPAKDDLPGPVLNSPALKAKEIQ